MATFYNIILNDSSINFEFGGLLLAWKQGDDFKVI